MRKYLCLIGILLLGCKQGPMIVFEKPQPENGTDLSTFPYRYRGIYKDNDSVFLSIDKKNIIRNYYIATHILKSQLDSFPEISYSGRQIKYVGKNESYFATERSDTIFWNESVFDTIFSISQFNRARKLMGYVVLNYMLDSNEWKVDLMRLNFRNLKLIDIGSKDDLAKLSEITEPEIKLDSTKNDTLKFILHPDKKEFRELLRIRDFKGQKEYKKIKPDLFNMSSSKERYSELVRVTPM